MHCKPTKKKCHCGRRISISHSVWFHRHRCRHFTKSWCHHHHTSDRPRRRWCRHAVAVFRPDRTAGARDVSDLSSECALHLPKNMVKNTSQKRNLRSLFEIFVSRGPRDVLWCFPGWEKWRLVRSLSMVDNRHFFYSDHLRPQEEFDFDWGTSTKNLASLKIHATTMAGLDLTNWL